mmetsp:Transcript_25615/g.59497  ORF Transcript_25615/g.59497 Transcript_25615/m.59497 type:complete len:92 (-) Transcript_25615:954-1229(-)
MEEAAALRNVSVGGHDAPKENWIVTEDQKGAPLEAGEEDQKEGPLEADPSVGGLGVGHSEEGEDSREPHSSSGCASKKQEPRPGTEPVCEK